MAAHLQHQHRATSVQGTATGRPACATICTDNQQLSAASRAASARPARATALMVRPLCLKEAPIAAQTSAQRLRWTRPALRGQRASVLSLYQLAAMASSLFTNTLHVCFDSVLAMNNPGMVSMFEALMESGLSGFFGCPAVLYEYALTEFFLNGSVRDGKVVSTIRGKQVDISEELFASTFELLVDGLTDLSEIPKDIVFDARSIFSFSGEQVSTSCKKREMKFEFRLLSDILAKKKSVKAGSFDAVTQERFFMMAAITCGVAINWNRLFNILKDMVTAGSRKAKGYAIQISILLENVPNLELGDSSGFLFSKILTKKTVHRYIAVNDKVGVEEVADVPSVKKTPVKKAMSRKRPAAVDEPIVKKKRTRVGKAADVATDSALEAVPIQVVAQISTVPLPAPKCKIEKRKRRLALDSDDEIVGEPTTVAVEVDIENIVEEQRVEMPVDPVDCCGSGSAPGEAAEEQ
ncbi:hypothetical protein F511_41782 [Dorcoceras hygrometricum]|uniref:Dystroglycan-like n=1 Tax=Dorcoceras hygrometricum TaxID=472368 RepID=A0A2Z7AA28_9LAMI|nr:hypothetical protein F511_41782 [Dorcoceras hygrometricum]